MCEQCSNKFDPTKKTKKRFCSYGCYWKSLEKIKDPYQRFMKYVEKTAECWIWKGHKNKDGYGNFSIRRKTSASHRYSWIFHKGEITKGMNVLHSCDNRYCVNPEHLFLGTQRDNMEDMIRKGRAWYMGPDRERIMKNLTKNHHQ